MVKNKVFSVCGMCTVKCPIQVDTEDGQVKFIQGNPNAAGLEGSVCARGGAGIALIGDDERPQYPMIRSGERGEGKWRQVTWDEALDYVVRGLKDVSDKYGGKSILFSDRGGPFRDLYQAFMRGVKSPNYSNHDATCARNVHHAAQSLFGFGREDLVNDLKNARHVVLQTRNILESINVKEVNDLTSAMESGCRLTVIDIRATVTATKADRFLMVRPGTDYAFNLAVIHELLAQNLYDTEFAHLWIKDLEKLRAFVRPYTPEWAEMETGIPAHQTKQFARELGEARPSVVWHPGWMNARYKDSFYVSRTIYIINALLGSVGAKGGMALSNTPADVGRKGLKKLVDLFPKPEGKRADGVGWRHSRFDSGPGLLNLAFQAIASEDPYPVKAYIACRHDPLMAFPDPAALKKIFQKLDLLVAVTFSWSDTAWYSDVILPLSPYLERESIIGSKGGLKPYFFIRDRAVEPRFDTRADWEIFTGLAKRLDMKPLSFNSIQEIWDYQLKDTGVKVEDFRATGLISLSDKPKYYAPADLKFKTPSGKIEIIAEKWEKEGIPSLKPYESPQKPEGRFRLTFGRCALHTQGHTVNNPALFQEMPENVLWINKNIASSLGINDGNWLEVSTGKAKGRIKAKVTEFIHPEAVFMVHGFGHALPIESRALGKGMADHELMVGGLDLWDPAGGAIALQEHFVTVRKAS